MSTASKSPPEKKGVPLKLSIHPLPIRVLVVDDHPVILEGLSSIIDRQGDMVVVAQASNGHKALELWQIHRPDVTLLDLRMPELDGIGTIAALHSYDRLARVIVLTIYDNAESIYQAVKAGARGYLLKDARREELLDSIRRVYGGGTYLPADVAAKMVQRVADETLSQREIVVLNLLAQGRSNRQIGAALSIGETTVKSHVKSIFAKLNVLSRTEAVTKALSRGLIDL